MPEAKGAIRNDNLLVPIGAAHKSNAEKHTDLYCEPGIAAVVAASV